MRLGTAGSASTERSAAPSGLGNERVAGRGIDDRTREGRSSSRGAAGVRIVHAKRERYRDSARCLGASTKLSIAMSGSMWLAFGEQISDDHRDQVVAETFVRVFVAFRPVYSLSNRTT
jgi:hypothetical protein